ncbi:ly-6/neurotoxin-like protein 1 isoform X1 [Callorhinus ursinus]|uniref:ly-6/neurotoxin-like protein 1 isoform X1 n=1 Tax=Callorhinus ursinus TaxID=34884 RepID=UPI003CD019FA
MRGARAIALSDRAVGEWRRVSPGRSGARLHHQEQRGGEAVKRDPPLGPSPALRALAMAPLLTLFLVALVGLPLAQALDCHVCAYNGENCFNPMRCPAMVTYCMTTRTYYTPTKMKVSKSCVPSCFETVYDGYSRHTSTTSCCQYDLCNSAGLSVPGTLALAPIFLATLRGLL